MAKLKSIQFLLATAAKHGWPINMFDFHSTFLNGELDPEEEVYMEQPQRYEESDKKWYMCKLLKSLYGLKQAGRKWYDALCRVLADIRFRQFKANPAVFYAHQDGNITILACDVDNCTITKNSQVLIQGYKDKLKEKYSLANLGPANWLLGRDLEAQTIFLSQSTYSGSQNHPNVCCFG